MNFFGGQLREYIESSPKRSELLPLVHTTHMMAAEGIFLKSKIEARGGNDEDQNKVVSLSYGKSTHIPNSDRLDSERLDCPVVFVLRSNIAANNMQVFPFDSSLYALGKLQVLTRNGVNIDSLEIGNSIDSAGRYVHVFYSSNGRYLDDKVNAGEGNVLPMPCPMAASNLVDLIAKRGDVERDRRYFTVEIRVSSDIVLTQDTVEHVVLPRFFMDPQYADYLSVVQNIWGVRPSFYKSCRFDPVVQAALASAKANEFVEDKYVDEK